MLFIISLIGTSSFAEKNEKNYLKKVDDEVRAKQISEMKFGMFICWSFSTFSGQEWTPTEDNDALFFSASGCDTDQWCRVAKKQGCTIYCF